MCTRQLFSKSNEFLTSFMRWDMPIISVSRNQVRSTTSCSVKINWIQIAFCYKIPGARPCVVRRCCNIERFIPYLWLTNFSVRGICLQMKTHRNKQCEVLDSDLSLCKSKHIFMINSALHFSIEWCKFSVQHVQITMLNDKNFRSIILTQTQLSTLALVDDVLRHDRDSYGWTHFMIYAVGADLTQSFRLNSTIPSLQLSTRSPTNGSNSGRPTTASLRACYQNQASIGSVARKVWVIGMEHMQSLINRTLVWHVWKWYFSKKRYHSSSTRYPACKTMKFWRQISSVADHPDNFGKF